MTPQSFLRACADLEQSLADLYRTFADRLPLDPEAGALFLDLAQQEDRHAQALLLVARLARGMKEETAVVGDAERVVAAMGSGLARAKALLAAQAELPVETALALALRIESSALEAHAPGFIRTDSEELRSAVRMLAADTDQHKARLEEMAARVRAREERPRPAT